MSDGGTNPFVPPYPPRPERLPQWRALIREGRRNSLSVLPRIAYERDLLTTRVLSRDIVLVNSPATVQEAFVDKHEVFQHRRRTVDEHDVAAQHPGGQQVPLIGDAR
ncbi:MAG: hypothetical protein EON47_16780, partial [Acetobacteraceae bacterium]